jgi:hypothetical protein
MPEKLSVNASDVKYIKLTINGNNESDFASLWEVRVYGTLKANNQTRPSQNGIVFPTINVATDRIKYVEGQSVTIFGSAINQLGKPLNAPLTIKVQQYVENDSSRNYEASNDNSLQCKKMSDCKQKMNSTHYPKTDKKIIQSEKKFSLFTVYSATVIPNGTYGIVLNKGLMPGDYNITSYIPHASAKAFNISNIGTLSTTIVKVQAWWESTPFKILSIGGLIGVIGLSIILWRGSKENRTHTDLLVSYGLLEFIFLSVIAFTPIATLALTDVALFPDSPVGIIIKPSVVVKSENVTQSIGEWMINIGGTTSDKYKAGIQVPIAIFIFGILGGYLRYLVSKADHKKNSDQRGQTVLPAKPIMGLNSTLSDLLLLFLSPLLAIAVWLVLFQGGTTSPLTLAAVSFAVGLATRQATEGLIAFVEKIFSPTPKEIA